VTLDIRDDVLASIHAASEVAVSDVPAAMAAYASLVDTLADDPFHRACVKHMYAVIVDDLELKLRLNEEALADADSVAGDGFPFASKATLYAAIGWSHRALGNDQAALPWYERAATAAALLDDDEYGRMMRANVALALEHLAT
jgi:hypothetical protein